MLKPSSPSFRQIPLKQMERGLALPIATLKLEPDQISERLGLRFDTARDELDELQAAVFSSKGGRQFALVRHLNQPNPGTDILINERSRNLSGALRDALRTLSLDEQELKWITPKAKTQSMSVPPHSRQFLFSSASLLKAAKIQERIERLESELDQVIQIPEQPTPLLVEARRQRSSTPQRSSRTERASGPLAPAVVRVLRSRGSPMGVSEILDGLLANGYKFNSPEPKKNLFARIYRLKGVKQVAPGRFTAT